MPSFPPPYGVSSFLLFVVTCLGFSRGPEENRHSPAQSISKEVGLVNKKVKWSGPRAGPWQGGTGRTPGKARPARSLHPGGPACLLLASLGHILALSARGDGKSNPEVGSAGEADPAMAFCFEQLLGLTFPHKVRCHWTVGCPNATCIISLRTQHLVPEAHRHGLGRSDPLSSALG